MARLEPFFPKPHGKPRVDDTMPIDSEKCCKIGIRACIPGRKQRKTTVKYDKRRYKRRNRIEIMFGRLKDWRRMAIRYDRCPKVFLSAIALAALVIYWL